MEDMAEYSNEPYEEKSRETLARLREGSVLLAHESLADPNFATTVILVCIHNAEGSLGLVLNRPSHMPLSEVFDLDATIMDQRRAMYIGGPVQQDALQILQVTSTPAPRAYSVAPDIFLGGEWPALTDILGADTAITRLFLGYSGWAAGQLENEILTGAWYVFNPALRTLLTAPDDYLRGDGEAIREYLGSI